MNEKQSLVKQIRQDRTILLIAILFGIAAVVMLMYYLNRKEKIYGEKMPVLVAAADIQKGASFSQSNVEIQRIPQQFVVPNHISPEYLSSILDSRTLVTIAKGQQISWNYPAVKEVQERLSRTLSKETNERAVTISVDEISGIAGHIAPNDRVDVIGTFQIPSTSKEKLIQTKTKTILQCVTVLAVGSSKESAAIPGMAGQDPRQYLPEVYSSVTLKVTPEEAELLTFAENAGTLRLLLRNPDDLDVAEDIPQIGFENLFEVEQKLTKQVKIRVHQESLKR